MADSTSDPKPPTAPGSKPAPQPEKKAAADPVQNPPTAFAAATHLINAKAMYGNPRHVVAGALALLRERGQDGDNGYTKDDVQAAVSDFLAREVKVDNPSEGETV